MIEAYSPALIWLIVIGFIIAFVLAFGIGANDVANSFGTSVGSKVITVQQACMLATVFEIAGAVLIGYKVSDTMRKGILEISVYEDAELELMLGCLSALASSAVWLLVATFFKLPISATHSIVGASIGFSLVSRGTRGLHWKTLLTIVISWFISPVLSGLISVLIFLGIKYFILKKPEPVVQALRSLPLFYGFTSFINIFSIIHDGPKLLKLDNISWWIALVSSLAVGLLIMLVVQLVVVPWQRRKLAALQLTEPVNFTFGESTESSPENSRKKLNRLSQLSDRTLTVISENTEMLPLDNKVSSTKYTFPNVDGDDEDKNGYMPASSATNNKEESNVTNNPTLSPNPTLSTNPSGATLIRSKSLVSSTFSPKSSAVSLIRSKSLVAKSNDQGICNVEMQENQDLRDIENNPSISKLFSFLQVLTASFGSFAHGGNDVSNAIGPLVALWLIYTEGSVQQKSETPVSILLYGGAGMCVGLWMLGRRVIQTIGEDLTTINPATGFTIEIGAAFTVLLASKVGLPISTTHCKVGSVVFVGYASSTGKGVDWRLFRNIISAWVVTVPVTAALSAVCMFVLQFGLLYAKV